MLKTYQEIADRIRKQVTEANNQLVQIAHETGNDVLSRLMADSINIEVDHFTAYFKMPAEAEFDNWHDVVREHEEWADTMDIGTYAINILNILYGEEKFNLVSAKYTEEGDIEHREIIISDGNHFYMYWWDMEEDFDFAEINPNDVNMEFRRCTPHIELEVEWF